MYSPSKENKHWTEVKREAWISSSIFGFSYALQAFGYDRFKKNAHKTIKGFEHVLNKMYIPETIPEAPKLHVNADKLREKAKQAKNMAKTVIVTN